MIYLFTERGYRSPSAAGERFGPLLYVARVGTGKSALNTLKPNI
jgi:hypothetical protein